MQYLVRWEHHGSVREAFTRDKATAYIVYQGILAYLAHDDIPVSIWDGATKVLEARS